MKSTFYPNHIVPTFNEKGLNLDTLTSWPANQRDPTKLRYKCVCGEDIVKSARNFMKKPLCISCTSKKQRKTVVSSRNRFIAALEKEGYKLLNPEVFENTKTYVNVQDPQGNVYQTTQNRFVVSGARSPFLALEKQKLSLDQVKKRVADAKFEWIEGANYVDTHTKFPVKCHCGNIFDVCLYNIREERAGCPKCYMYNRKYDWEYIEGYADKYGCTIITSGEEYHGRDTIINVLCACGEEIMKNVRMFMKAPRCSNCSKCLRAETNVKKYGRQNYFEGELGREAVKQALLKKYGVDHNMKLESCKQKAKDTCFKNYGTDCVFKLPSNREMAIQAHIERHGGRPGCVQEIAEKMKATNNERYGADYPLQSKQVHATIKKNNKEKYGNGVFIQSDVGKKLMMEKYGNKMFIHSDAGKKLMLEKYGNECFTNSDAGKKLMLEKYGNERFLVSDAFKQVMMEKYGAECAMHVPEFFEKAMRSAFKLKLVTFPSGRTEMVQGYEHLCLAYLLHDEKIHEDDIVVGPKKVPKVMYMDGIKDRRYFMDIYIKSQDKGIEVKSAWTYAKHDERAKNRAKWLTASKLCTGGFDVYVFDKKRGLLCQIMYKNGEIQEFSFQGKLPFRLLLDEFS